MTRVTDLKAAWYKKGDTIGGTVIANVIATLIVTSILFVFSFIIDFFNKVTLLTTVKSIVEWSWNLLLVILKFEIKVWWLLVLIAGVSTVIILFKKYYTQPVKRRAFLDYKAKRQKLEWRWSYDNKPNSNYYGIMDLAAYCDDCDTKLVFTTDRWGNYMTAECPRCEREYLEHQIDDEHKIKSIVEDDIRRIDEGLKPYSIHSQY